jgi:hypothetical protein
MRIRPDIFLVSSVLLTLGVLWLLPSIIECVRSTESMRRTYLRLRCARNHYCRAHYALDRVGCGKSGVVERMGAIAPIKMME